MTVELNPVGVNCNLGCTYCYENPMRDAGNFSPKYDLDAMFKTLDETQMKEFTVFGGEPLLMPIVDLEKVFSYGFSKFGKNGIQTNGSLITTRHLELFQRYNVHVGVSIDGPGELNDARISGTLESTRSTTRKSEEAIHKLCASGKIPSLIITLHRMNTGDRLETLKDWILSLDKLGVSSVRLHLLENDKAENLKLTDEENISTIFQLLEMETFLKNIKFDLFREMTDLLQGDNSNVSCIWHGCDPYTTPAVHGIDSDGSLSNCGRTNKDGVSFRKSSSAGRERTLALYHTPQQYKGCKDCRFFVVCRGECPGTGHAGDWRNRTDHCNVLKAIFARKESELLNSGITPITLRPDLKARELALLYPQVNVNHGDSHGDVPHGDMPHGDSGIIDLGIFPCKD